MEDYIITYTTAPESYDWFGTQTLDSNVGTDVRGNTIRKVQGPALYIESQRGRYRSGLHMAADEAEWLRKVQAEQGDSASV